MIASPVKSVIQELEKNLSSGIQNKGKNPNSNAFSVLLKDLKNNKLSSKEESNLYLILSNILKENKKIEELTPETVSEIQQIEEKIKKQNNKIFPTLGKTEIQKIVNQVMKGDTKKISNILKTIYSEIKKIKTTQKKEKKETSNTNMISIQSPIQGIKRPANELKTTYSQQKTTTSDNNSTLSAKQNKEMIGIMKIRNELKNNLNQKNTVDKNKNDKKKINVSTTPTLSEKATETKLVNGNHAEPTNKMENSVKQLIHDKVVKLTQDAKTGQVTKMTIQLHPENLGAITIEVSKTETGVEAMLKADNPQLNHNLNQLMVMTQHSMKEQGVQLNYTISQPQNFQEKRRDSQNKEQKQNEERKNEKRNREIEKTYPKFKI